MYVIIIIIKYWVLLKRSWLFTTEQVCDDPSSQKSRVKVEAGSADSHLVCVCVGGGGEGDKTNYAELNLSPDQLIIAKNKKQNSIVGTKIHCYD